MDGQGWRWRQRVAAGLVLAFVGAALWLYLGPGGRAYAVVAAWRGQGDSRLALEVARSQALDQVYHSYGSNVYLRFVGFRADAWRDTQMVQEHYFKAVYGCVPERVFCAPSPVVINRGADLLRAQADFTPDAAYLHAHGIGALVTLRLDAAQQVRAQVVFVDDAGGLWLDPAHQQPAPANALSAPAVTP